MNIGLAFCCTLPTPMKFVKFLKVLPKEQCSYVQDDLRIIRPGCCLMNRSVAPRQFFLVLVQCLFAVILDGFRHLPNEGHHLNQALIMCCQMVLSVFRYEKKIRIKNLMD